MSKDFEISINNGFHDHDVLQFSEIKDLIKVQNFKECFKKSVFYDNSRGRRGLALEFICSLEEDLRCYDIFLENPQNFLDTGIECEVLRLGSNGWVKGKLKMSFELEIIPDEPEITEPESPLDDIRREINQT